MNQQNLNGFCVNRGSFETSGWHLPRPSTRFSVMPLLSVRVGGRHFLTYAIKPCRFGPSGRICTHLHAPPSLQRRMSQDGRPGAAHGLDVVYWVGLPLGGERADSRAGTARLGPIRFPARGRTRHRAICPATAQRSRCWGELSVPPDHLKVGVETFYKLTCLVSVTAGGVEQRRGPRCGSRRRARKGANGVESVFVAEYAVMSSDVPCGRGSRGPLGGPLHPVGTRLRTASRREPRAGPPLVVKEGPAAIRAGADRQRLNGLDYPCGEWASFAVPERANGSDRGTESYPRPSGIECNTNSLKE